MRQHYNNLMWSVWKASSHFKICHISCHDLHQNLCGISGILRTFHTVKTWFLFIWFAHAQHFWCSMVSVSWTIAQYTTPLNSISLPHRMTLKPCSLWQVSSTLCNQSSRYQICWIIFRQITTSPYTQALYYDKH